MQSIHCKVSLGDQYRRFLFSFTPSEGGSGSLLKNLLNNIRNLYGIGGEFTLKYKDDEGDLIIIGCDQELDFAITQAAKLLRLFIEVKDVPMISVGTTTTTTIAPTADTVIPLTPDNNYDYGRGGHHGRGRGNWYGRHGHGPKCHEHGHYGPKYHEHGHHGKRHGHGPKCHGKRRYDSLEELTSKRDLVAAALNDPSVTTDEYKKQKLNKKLECINRRLSIATQQPKQQGVEGGSLNDESSSSKSGDEKWRKKKSDKYKKKYGGCGKREKRVRRIWTEDERAVVQVLKAQIRELKPSLNVVKIQLCEKKAQKAKAEERGDVQRAEELNKEIQSLKEIKKEHQNAMAPLKQQIYALKFEEQC